MYDEMHLSEINSVTFYQFQFTYATYLPLKSSLVFSFCQQAL